MGVWHFCFVVSEVRLQWGAGVIEMARGWFSLVLVAVSLLLSACGGEPGDGLAKSQVTGQVFVNGKPYPKVIVSLFHTDPTVKGNAATPVAATSDDGTFRLSTNSDKDGAVAGKYRVTFFWSDGGAGMSDFLKGKYSRIEGSKFEVTINGSGEQALEPFRLETTEANLAAAVIALEAKRTAAN
jgi:hypothetical protein